VLTFFPKPGQILLCDYDMATVPPEMRKKRPVAVISPYQHNKRYGVCAVVPFSTVAPSPIERFHYRIPAGRYPFQDAVRDTWAKCNMLGTVSFARLSRVTINRREEVPELNPADLTGIRTAAAAFLEFSL
jgi:mRNA interferase MazF